MSKKHILKSAGIIGFATIISRILGFLRDILIAGFFGTELYAQAFVVAFRIPNMLRDLVGEGATNAAFVPVLSECYAKEGKKVFWEVSNILLNLVLVVLSIITLLGIAFTPLIVRVLVPGFTSDPEKLRVTIYLTRLIFPYVFLVGLLAYAMGVLNTLKHFTFPAFAPSILNLTIIICALIKKGSVTALSIGILLGGVIQLAMQLPILYKKGFSIKDAAKIFKKSPYKTKLKHPAIKKIGLLLIPRALGSCVYHINLLVNTMLASLSGIVGLGGVAALYYANRIFQFPLAIFGMALAQAALPTMSREALEEGSSKLRETISFSLRSINFIMVPSAFGLIILSHPITRVLFERGKFTEYSTFITSRALMFYSIGLFSYSGIKILVSTFYSLKDTFTPVKIAGISLLLNILLNLLFIYPLKLSGLALATSLSGIVNFFILFFVLKKRIGDIEGRKIFISFLRVLMASLFMGAIIYVCAFRYNINLFIVIFIGIISYFLGAFVFRVKELSNISKWILRQN